MSTTILIADDHPVFRKGLRALVDRKRDLQVVAEAGDGLEAIDRTLEFKPDIVLMDISMPNLDGIQATRRILVESPGTRVVALSVHGESQFVRDMIQAGARGYILKESIPEEMFQGIERVMAGYLYLSAAISNIVVDDYKRLLLETEQRENSALMPILHTKFLRPRLSADIIPRSRLIQLLEEGRHRPLTLISAPAGYGKSILASQWLESSGCPGAWVSLDENDSDLRLFLAYFLQAVQNTFTGVVLETKKLLQASSLPPVKVLTLHLLNDLEKVEEPFVLVLDGYSHIREDAVHDLLIELIRYPSPKLHLVVLTRYDPPFPTGLLRARNQLSEITIRDLRFSIAETKEFIQRCLSVAVDEDTASVLEEKVEGWAVGLRLMLLSLKKKENWVNSIEEIKQDIPSDFVNEYLIHEVLAHTPPAFRQYLLQTSILDRFCPPLCAVLQPSQGVDAGPEAEISAFSFIDWLEKTQLFVFPLDEVHHWFRYHHLFQELLRNHLRNTCGRAEIAALHLRASEWFAANGLIDEAIQHALAGNDEQKAAQQMELNRKDLLNTDQWYVLKRWLSKFPGKSIRQRPELLMAKAWILYHQFEMQALPSVLEAIELRLGEAEREQSMQGEIDFFHGYLLYFQNDGAGSLRHLQDALERVPETDHELRGQCEILHGLAAQMQGEQEKEIEKIQGLLAEDRLPPTIRIARLRLTLVCLHIVSGDLKQALLESQLLQDFAVQHAFTSAGLWSLYLQGLIHFYQNDLTRGIDFFQFALQDKYLLHARAAVDALAGLAYAYQGVNQPDLSRAAIKDLFEYVDHLKNEELMKIAGSAELRLSIMQGELSSGEGWLQEGRLVENMVWWLEVPVLSRCRVYLAEGSTQGLDRNEARLRELLQLNQENHNICQMIQILLLLALTCDKRKRLDEALIFLQRAVELAKEGGWIRPFVEPGDQMFNLLKELQQQNPNLDYAGKLLAAFPGEEFRTGPKTFRSDRRFSNHSDSRPGRRKARQGLLLQGAPVLDQSLDEPLTNRELDVLQLLAQRFQNKEIAARLFVSSETVKAHLKNIYQKLNTANRREAVETAKRIGIL